MIDLPPIPQGHSHIILNSYKHWTGRDLISKLDANQNLDQQLFYAPLVILSHGLEEDPILNYGNQQALELWAMTFASFTNMPSRLTAEPQNREERQKLLDEVQANGFTDAYSGIRINQRGQRFFIEQATVWNLIDDQGNAAGQAACFKDFEMLKS